MNKYGENTSGFVPGGLVSLGHFLDSFILIFHHSQGKIISSYYRMGIREKLFFA